MLFVVKGLLYNLVSLLQELRLLTFDRPKTGRVGAKACLTRQRDRCLLVCYLQPCIYINNSLHLARKYARTFVREHYLFREANSFLRAKLEENCELRGTDNVQGQISEHIFAAKLRLLCLLSMGFKNWEISSNIPQF